MNKQEVLISRESQERWLESFRQRRLGDSLLRYPLQSPRSRLTRSFSVTDELAAVTKGDQRSVAAVVVAVFAVLLGRYFNLKRVLVGCPGKKTSDGIATGSFALLSLEADAPLRNELVAVAAELERCLGAAGMEEHTLRKIGTANELANVIDFAIEGAGLGVLPRPCREVAFVLELADGEISLSYSRSFDAQFIELMLVRTLAICTSIRTWSNQSSMSLELVPEQFRALEARTAIAGLPSTFSILERIASISRTHTDAPAVRCGSEVFTYQQLQSESDALAVRLMSRGVGRGAIVAVFMERQVRYIASILAVLKTGAAFLPLDTALPESRLQFICTDANVHTLMTTIETSVRLPDVSSAVFVVDMDDQSVSSQDFPIRLSDDLCYVFYTSGSSGQPKGVMVEDHALSQLTHWLCDKVYRSGATDKALLTASFSFDASLQQIFSPLCCGCELIVTTDRERRDPMRYADLLIAAGVTVLDITPAFLAKVVDVVSRRNMRTNVQTILVGGDILARTLALKVKDQFPDTSIINVYGTTETGCNSTYHVVQDDENGTAVPAGVPLPGAIITIETSTGEILPRTIFGEICIGGAGVGRNYIHAVETDRFVNTPGGAKFRTRDLGVIDQQGRLHVFGRMDQEVKIQGYRVDLTGVANAIRKFRSGASALRQTDLVLPQATKSCRICALPDSYPGATLNDAGVCSICERYERQKKVWDSYFQIDVQGLAQTITKANQGRQSKYDCMLLYSGGKDSSYVLYRLVDLGYRVLAFTFDNGHISKAAFDNIRRQTSLLGVTSHVASVDNMDRIFLESLYEDSTVCSGCFRALTATSTRLATELNIGCVLTGLSRGQIAETKLERLVSAGVTQVDEIERQLMLMRTVYHAAKDTVNGLLEVEISEDALSKIQFLDFFRYDPIRTDEVLNFLVTRDEYWAKPADTGFCSSNCMINDSGVCVHLRDRKYHNYSAPLAWDLRLGVALADNVHKELRTDLPLDRINRVLKRLGYFNNLIKDVAVTIDETDSGSKAICAYFVAEENISQTALRQHLLRELPAYMIPTYFIPCKSIPLTPSGKLDSKALPSLDRALGSDKPFIAPNTEIEQVLASVWMKVLKLERVGIDDSFFALGGKSLDLFETQLILDEQHGMRVDITDMFQAETVRNIALTIEKVAGRSGSRVRNAFEQYDV
jgi:amino acid adenylation domain-containing protein